MDYEILSEISSIEIIAVGSRIRELSRLQNKYGRGRWRKMKGTATVGRPDGTTCQAEVHWYEAQNIGRKDFKVKHELD